MSKSVTVLMSSYNGERYIGEQIDSLLNQCDIDLRILVRDDGSTDNTVRIIDDYINRDNRIQLICAENVGPAISFIKLLTEAKNINSDYYAFCDQDDIWDEDKLSAAVLLLMSLDDNLPNCYYSNLRLVDSDLNFIAYAHQKRHSWTNQYSSLITEEATGCTMVFNRKTVELLCSNLPDTYSMHDALVFTFCKLLGETIYDPVPHISYRQHQNNVIGMSSRKKGLAMLKKRIKRIVDSNKNPIFDNANTLYSCYERLFRDETKKHLKLIINYKNGPFHKCRLLFNPTLHASSLSDDLRYRFLILIGRV